MGNLFAPNVPVGLFLLAVSLGGLLWFLSLLRVPACCLQLAGLLFGFVFMSALLAFGILRV